MGHNNDVEINNGFCPTIMDQQASLFVVTMKNNCTNACMLSPFDQSLISHLR